MYLVEIFLPTFDNAGNRFPKDAFDRVREELTDRFGGVTAFLRSPAIGLWQDNSGAIHQDEIAVFEVMADKLDRIWWHEYRLQLEERFRQDEIVIRAREFEAL